ncbi:MAG: hypothetical protein ABIG46_05860 [Candidatus Omnitrophota bacterium]
MHKKTFIGLWAIVLLIALLSSGCALVNLALNAGLAYGIYEVSK